VFLIGRKHTGHGDDVSADVTIRSVLLQLVIRAIPATAQDGRDDVGFVDAIMISHGALQTDNDHPAR
jgi:hypothetical protein